MRRLISLVALATVLSACGSDSSTQPTPSSFAGTWSLTTVNGAVLPFNIPAATPMTEVMSDTFVFSADGTFTEAFNLRVTDAGVVTTESNNDSGTFRLSGSTLTLRFNSDGTSGTATLSGNTFTVAVSGFTSIYTKQ